MRKVIFQVNMTLDGFTSGLDGNLDWAIVDPDSWHDLFARYDQLDTVLLGRINYEGFEGYWPAVAHDPHASATDRAFARWYVATPKVVFSHTLTKVGGQNSQLATRDVQAEIAHLKAQPGKDMLVMNSTTLVHSMLEDDLVDEFWLTVVPVAIGEGIPLFDKLKQPLKLQLLEAKGYPLGPVMLRYARVKDGA